MLIRQLNIVILIIISIIIMKSGSKEINSFFKTDISEETKFNSKEFLAMEGEWEIVEFMGTGIQSHIDPYENGYNISEEEIEEHKLLYLNSKIIIDKETVNDFYPPEFKYYYDNVEELFFGYKIPFCLETPVLYINIEHKDFGELINFIRGGDGNVYLDIGGYFYRLEKLS